MRVQSSKSQAKTMNRQETVKMMNKIRSFLFLNSENGKETSFNTAQNITETELINTNEKNPEVHTKSTLKFKTQKFEYLYFE